MIKATTKIIAPVMAPPGNFSSVKSKAPAKPMTRRSGRLFIAFLPK
jgi:hypothetical protein